MKSYEELLSDIEEDMELMGSSHIVYSMESVSAQGSAVPWKAMLPASGKEKVSARGVNRMLFTVRSCREA